MEIDSDGAGAAMTRPEVDLAALTRRLDQAVPRRAREGLVVGKTAFRDAVAEQLSISLLAAEEVVDTLVARGFLRFVTDPRRLAPDEWTVELEP